ncbi:MAG: NUDIX domain-containing protein [Nocardioidaceae bacterium]
MPRLIHLNGPSGIGKSTLAQMYVDDHPGVLNLDIDVVRCLVGGWQDGYAESGALVRPIALSMAGTHLRAGHDVIMPQFLGRLAEIERFASVARDSGARFCEVVLMDTKERALERFTHRSRSGALRWHRQVQEVVDRLGGVPHLAGMYDCLVDVLASRPTAVIVPSNSGAVRQTYAALSAVLDDLAAHDSPAVTATPPRAVAVVVRDAQVLLIKRHQHGRDYAVLPGGGIEPGETAEVAALRELLEETTLVARIEHRLWSMRHDDRHATYFLMADVEGTPLLAGAEAAAHCPQNSFELRWAGVDDFEPLNLQPSVIRRRLGELIS